MIFKRFIFLAFGSFMAVVSVVGIFNTVVDPFDVYRLVRSNGFNEIKPLYGEYTRLAKVIQIERFPRTTIALGSSRAQFGVDMQHEFWGNGENEKGWNLALSGAHMYEVSRLFDHAVDVSDVEKVLIGLDFFMFNANRQGHLEDESYFSVDKNGTPQSLHQLRQRVLTMGTTDAISASFETLRKQKVKEDKFNEFGRMLSQRERSKALDDGGFERVFLQNEAAYARQTWTACKNNSFPLRKPEVNGPLELLEKILEKAAKRKIEVVLFISPSHARLWETLDATGLWAEFEQWKRELTKSIQKVKIKNGSSVQLWDFSGFSDYSTEKVPAENDKAMKWYLDPSHYSVELGRLMLDVIHAGTRDAGGERVSFGRPMNVSTIDQLLIDIRNERAKYRLENPELIKRIWTGANKQLEERTRVGEQCSNVEGKGV